MAQGVEFEEDKNQFTKPAAPAPEVNPYSSSAMEQQYMSSIQGEPKMVQWLIRHGYAKSPAFGRILLLIAIVINALITYFVIKNFL